MSEPKPSLELLRGLTDEHVLRAFMSEPQLTRAQVAALTQISKPTVSHSVRRLTEAGLLRDTGARTTGRGAVGSYFALSGDVGSALAVSIQPEGIIAEVVDALGNVSASVMKPVERSATGAKVTRLLTEVCVDAIAQAGTTIALAAVSAADPVERTTGRLLELPDAAFLVGNVDPVTALEPLVAGPVLVDNDVNWAARAERASSSSPMDNFAYLFLGEGLGCAVVSDGEVRRGHRGLAGEISHVTATGPRQRAMPFTHVFKELDLRHPGENAINVAQLIARTTGGTNRAVRTRSTIASAVVDVLSALISLTEPEFVIIGGPWGSASHVFAAIDDTFRQAVRNAPLRTASITDNAPLAGARRHATEALQDDLISRHRLA